MTVQPTRDQLSRRAGHILFTQGPEQPAATGREVTVLFDLLAAAEALATRAEAQSRIRGRAVVMYRERAREAEARIKAVEDVLDKVEAGESWFRPVDFSGTPFPITVDTSDIRRALEG